MGQDPGLMNYADKFLGDVQQAIPGWRRVHSAAQGLTPPPPAYTDFMGGLRDIGSDIPFLRRLISGAGSSAAGSGWFPRGMGIYD